MTRKDYVLIADSLSKCLNLSRNHNINPDLVEAIAHQLAHDLGNDNPRFDRERFLKACGVEVK